MKLLHLYAQLYEELQLVKQRFPLIFPFSMPSICKIYIFTKKNNHYSFKIDKKIVKSL